MQLKQSNLGCITTNFFFFALARIHWGSCLVRWKECLGAPVVGCWHPLWGSPRCHVLSGGHWPQWWERVAVKSINRNSFNLLFHEELNASTLNGLQWGFYKWCWQEPRNGDGAFCNLLYVSYITCIRVILQLGHVVRLHKFESKTQTGKSADAV